MAKMKTVRRRARIANLEAEISRLKAVIGLDRGPGRYPGMTPSETTIFKAIAEQDRTTKALAVLLYGETYRAADFITIKTFIARVRRKIAPHNLTITAVHAWGYTMSIADRMKARALLQEAADV